MPTTQKILTYKHIEFMKPFFILLGLSICVMSLSAQEAYQYNQFYYQRSTLFEKLPIDSDDIGLFRKQYHERLRMARVIQ